MRAVGKPVGKRLGRSSFFPNPEAGAVVSGSAAPLIGVHYRTTTRPGNLRAVRQPQRNPS